MGIDLIYSVGATPLDPDEAAALIPNHISNQEQLNAWELRNVLEGEGWAFAAKRTSILSLDFFRTLHKRMFGDTWRWAGTFRASEKNIGIDPAQIASELKKLCDDVAYQMRHASYPPDEIAARFHHRLTWVHPFPNGNGRFSRTMADLLLVQNGGERFTWGAGDLVVEGDVRKRYIQALQAADRRDYAPLLEFVRSA